MEEINKTDYLPVDEYTFENFITGASNKFAYAAACAVAVGGQKQIYNPLFIYSKPGLGKTHLLYAIRSEMKRKDPKCNCIYIKGSDYTDDLVESIRQGKINDFNKRYRSADLLLIDDVQFVAGKKYTQEEFFKTFDALYERGKQIVFTSDKPPSEFQHLEQRNKAQFEAGIFADIQAPDESLRIAIIRKKAELLGVVLPDDVVDFIANNLISNVRCLEGAVKIIIAHSEITGENITVEFAKKSIAKIIAD